MGARKNLGVAGLILGSLLAGRSAAQCLSFDSRFSYPNGTDGLMTALAVFDDGAGPALFAGGTFSRIDGVAASNVARWSGSEWTPLGTGTDGAVQALAVFDDGSGPALYAGGTFTSAGGVNAKCIAKWNGAIWSPVGTGLTGPWFPVVYALAVYDDGTGAALYATGQFTSAGPATAVGIARWNGTAWSPVGSGLGGASPDGFALKVHDDGTGPALFVGGRFSAAGGTVVNYVAKWNGVAWSGLAGGMNHYVLSLGSFDAGSGAELHAGGYFTTAGGTAQAHMARWNGSAWSSVGGGASGYPYSMAVHDDGAGPALFVGGYITSAGTFPASAVAKWDGSAWSPLGSGLNGTVDELAIFDEGAGPRLFAVGNFSLAAGSIQYQGIARWDGSTWSAVGSHVGHGIQYQVEALCSFDDGSGAALYAGGPFPRAGGYPILYGARWNGQTWSPIGSGFSYASGAASRVNAITPFDHGTGPALYFGGWGLTIPGVGGSSLARWDGTSWSFAPATYGPGEIQALGVYDSGGGPGLYVGGSFTYAGGVSSTNIARWSGSSWSAVGGGVNGTVYALAVYDEGAGPRLFVGGAFTTAGGFAVNYLARWDGSSWSQVGGGVGYHVYALEVFDDGNGPALYVGGYFSSAGGVPVSSIARWNGLGWTPLGGGVSATSYTAGVLALHVFDDGDGPALFAGGDFENAGGQPARGIARWRSGAWSPVGAGVDLPVRALATYDDGQGGGPDLYLGGLFTTAGALDSVSIAQWHGCLGPVSGFCYGDGSLSACPCGNEGLANHGCENSAATGGARLYASGSPVPDTLVLHAVGELPSALSIFLQGDVLLYAPAPFGDGLRCAGGNLKRLYVKSASAGAAIAPQGGDPSITAQSAALGDPIVPGTTRVYQTYYRDPDVNYCAAPAGGTFNATNGLRVVW